ncbi:TRAP transporter substrate-binding protein [uncultured Oscillibacter sp.]|uniref:TRAP transporter substrate-binding protein n=1 Tax=uncultured Oscillibacter sp. TaxID=876091 RepID=UPI00260ABCF7|nr:TRAP transporter substrate-binding protein [uncultured Oscillibacter sp.]
MKKTLSLVLALVMLLALVGCGGNSSSGAPAPSNGGNNASAPVNSSSDEVYTPILTIALSKDDYSGDSMFYLGKILEERSGGRIKPTVYTDMAFTSGDTEQAEVTMNNTAQISICSSFALATLAPELKRFLAFDVPYLFQTDEEVYAYADSDLNRETLDKMPELLGLRAYPQYSRAWCKISTGNKEIKVPSDLRGLKIRSSSSDLYCAFLEDCGAVPSPMAYGEVYTGLQQHTIDGMMTTTPHWYFDKFCEVQDYMVACNAFVIAHTPIVNNEWFESLPEDLQEVVDTCMWDYLEYVRKGSIEKGEQECIDKMRNEYGMMIHEPSEAEYAQWVEAGKSTWDLAKTLLGEDDFSAVSAFVENVRGA